MKRFLSTWFMILLTGGSLRAEPDMLEVMAYNIKHGRGMDGKVDLERIAGVLAAQKVSLIALQEVDRNCTRSGNQDIAAKLGKALNMKHGFAKFMDFQGGEYGLAVLSRYPIIEQRRIPLPPGSQEPRCALEVVVKPEGATTKLSFVSIHNDWIDEKVRLAQVKALLDALVDRKHPVILCGDFNGERNDASVKLLAESGWQVLEKQGKPETFPSVKPRKEIDFMITRGISKEGTRCVVIDERVASDHRPVRAAVRMP